MKTVMAGGVFNIVHPGHIDFFEKARRLGDRLIVVVAHDKTVLRKKGILVMPAEDRKTVVENMKPVDKAVIGSDGDVLEVVEREMPDIIALGYDQDFREDWFRKELKKRNLDCKVIRLESDIPEYSTKKIIEKIKKG